MTCDGDAHWLHRLVSIFFPMKNTTHNLNDTVRFKLTEKGRAHLTALNRTHPVYSRCPLKYQADADGWIETQLWDFANVFGPTMGMGFDQTVETAIELRSCLG